MTKLPPLILPSFPVRFISSLFLGKQLYNRRIVTKNCVRILRNYEEQEIIPRLGG
jgi:hypothetical protein